MKTLLLLGIFVFGVAGQSLTEPPPLIRVTRRPAPDASVIQRYADAGAGVHVFGMTSVTGLSGTALIEAHDTFASIERVDRAVRPNSATAQNDDPPDQNSLGPGPDDVLASSRSLIALYRPRWSYRPDQAIRMFAKARYFQVSIYRVRPRAEADFAQIVKLWREGIDSVNLDRPDLVYQVISGAPSETYLFLAPLTSLATLDEALARAPDYAARVQDAAKAGSKLAAAEIGRQHLLFRVEPAMSYVSDDFASADVEFWRPKAKEP